MIAFRKLAVFAVGSIMAATYPGTASGDRLSDAAEAYDKCILTRTERRLTVCEGAEAISKAVVEACAKEDQEFYEAMFELLGSRQQTDEIMADDRERRINWIVSTVREFRLQQPCED